jgi:hypothetical protein
MRGKMSIIHGGYAKDYKGFPTVFSERLRKREVSVKIMQYYSIGVHFYT